MSADIAAEYKSETVWLRRDKCQMHVVVNDRDCEGFAWLIGSYVLLDGERVKVLDVERYATRTNPKGQMIGLLVA